MVWQGAPQAPGLLWHLRRLVGLRRGPLNADVRRHLIQVPQELVDYHNERRSLLCEVDVQPWICEFWPLASLGQLNQDYGVPEFAPGHVGFASNGAGEMYAFSPAGRIVCLTFIGMSPAEELAVAPSWQEFAAMLRSAV